MQLSKCNYLCTVFQSDKHRHKAPSAAANCQFCRCQVLLTAAAEYLHVFLFRLAAIMPQTAAASKIFQLLM
jgi:hypothetical protein